MGVLQSHATERSLSIQPPFRSCHKKFSDLRMDSLEGLLPRPALTLVGVISPLLEKLYLAVDHA